MRALVSSGDTDAAAPSLLTGFLYDDRGNRLIPSHCTKGAKRYRYNFSQATLKPGAAAGARGIGAGAQEFMAVDAVSGQPVSAAL